MDPVIEVTGIIRYYDGRTARFRIDQHGATEWRKHGSTVIRLPLSEIVTKLALKLNDIDAFRFEEVTDQTSIEELELSVRAFNCLKRNDIHNVGELLQQTEEDLLDIRNFGAKCLAEVKAVIAPRTLKQTSDG